VFFVFPFLSSYVCKTIRLVAHDTCKSAGEEFFYMFKGFKVFSFSFDGVLKTRTVQRARRALLLFLELMQIFLSRPSRGFQFVVRTTDACQKAPEILP